ncbi:MAG: hypothetical protein ACYDDF_06195 [Thermoplasmatota archaeon]
MDLRNDLTEIVRALISFGVIFGGGFFVWHLWFDTVPTRDPNGLISAIFAIMAGVLGWFFGSRGVDRAQEAAMKAEIEAQREKADLTEAIKEGQDSEETVRRMDCLLKAAESDAVLARKLEEYLAPLAKEGDE